MAGFHSAEPLISLIIIIMVGLDAFLACLKFPIIYVAPWSSSGFRTPTLSQWN
jgi:hypothetical protein